MRAGGSVADWSELLSWCAAALRIVYVRGSHPAAFYRLLCCSRGQPCPACRSRACRRTMSELLQGSYEVVYTQLPGSYSSAARFVRLRELLLQVGCGKSGLDCTRRDAHTHRRGRNRQTALAVYHAPGIGSARTGPAHLPPRLLHLRLQVCGADDTPYPTDPNWSPSFDGVGVRMIPSLHALCCCRRRASCTICGTGGLQLLQLACLLSAAPPMVAPSCNRPAARRWGPPLALDMRRMCRHAQRWRRRQAFCRQWRLLVALPPRWLAGHR